MEFGWGLVIGILSGTNIGVIMAGLLAGTKRDEPCDAYGWGQLHVDQAVWYDTAVESVSVSRPFPAGSPDAAAH